MARVSICSKSTKLILFLASTRFLLAPSVYAAGHSTDGARRSRPARHDSASLKRAASREESEPDKAEVRSVNRGMLRGDAEDVHTTWPHPDHEQKKGGIDITESTSYDSASASSRLSFKSTNVYPAVTWSPWEHIAEPYREAVLRADSTVGDPDGDLFMWTIPTENGAVYEGRCARDGRTDG